MATTSTDRIHSTTLGVIFIAPLKSPLPNHPNRSSNPTSMQRKKLGHFPRRRILTYVLTHICTVLFVPKVSSVVVHLAHKSSGARCVPALHSGKISEVEPLKKD